MPSEYEYRFRIEAHGDAFAIIRAYRDGYRVIEGVYSARADAAAELRLIREAEAA
jgi:hypothetical protein